MIDKKYHYALVGASSNPEKYGYKVFKYLLEKGYNISPINPKGGTILEQKVFENLSVIQNNGKDIDVVILITPPSISLKILEEVKQLGIDKVWFQPGASDKTCIEFCNAYGIEEVHNACMMIRG